MIHNFLAEYLSTEQSSYIVFALLIVAILIVLTIGLLLFFSKKKKTVTVIEKIAVTPEPKLEKEKPQIIEEEWSERLKKGLSRSRQDVWGKLGNIFSNKKIDAELLDSAEELLYSADLGTKITAKLMNVLQKDVNDKILSEAEFKNYLFQFLKNEIEPIQTNVDSSIYLFNKDDSARPTPKVIMIAGVNGAGKTTTIGKLATKLNSQGAKVVVGACDTFRAAAVDQLQIWCDRANVKMVRAKEGSNPSGVAYEALQQAINEKADYCILDTAGRAHTKVHLMEELTKTKRVLQKLDVNAPHSVLLVLDAITGQNAVRQAEEFHKALNVTGLIFTKCDGSSKAGSAVSIVESLKIPIVLIGVGESVNDLNIFNLEEYLSALLELTDA